MHTSLNVPRLTRNQNESDVCQRPLNDDCSFLYDLPIPSQLLDRKKSEIQTANNKNAILSHSRNDASSNANNDNIDSSVRRSLRSKTTVSRYGHNIYEC